MTKSVPRARLHDRSATAGTTARFALLVVLILASSVFMARMGLVAAGFSDGGACLLAGGHVPNADPPPELLRSQAYQRCTAQHSPAPPWLAPAALAALPIAAGALFLLLPAWKARRGRFVPLAEVDDDGAIRRDLERFAELAGLSRLPRVVVDPAAVSVGAVVFGRTGRPTLCLHGGLLTRRTTAPEDFRGVLLHELAHIRNGDITLTYATVALWRVFTGLVLLPYAAGFLVLIATTLSQDGARYVGLPAVRATVLPLFLAVLVHLARADVLRTRELHADATAARWGADTRRWGGAGDAAPPPGARRVLARLAELWSTHPGWQRRRAALGEPASLFTLPALPMLLTGAATTLINGNLWAHLALELPGAWLGRLVMTLAPALLITGVVGVGIRRAVLHAARTGHPAPSGARAGLWLGIGMAVGELFVSRIATTRWLPGQPVVVLLLVAAGAVFGWWVHQTTHLWLSTRPGHARTGAVPVLATACLGLFAWFWWWAHSGVVLANLGDPLGGWSSTLVALQTGDHAGIVDSAVVVSALTNTVLASPLALLAIVAAWAVPLWIWATGPAGPSRPPLRRPLLAGALGGVLCWAGIVGTKAVLHGWSPPLGQRGTPFALLYQAWTSTALLAGAVLAATVASVAVPRHRLIAALIAAHTAVLTGFAVVWVLTASDGCIPPLATLAPGCQWRPAAALQGFQFQLAVDLVLSALLAIAAAGIVAALRARDRGAAPPRPGGPGRRGARLICAGVLSAVAAGFLLADAVRERPDAEHLGEEIQAAQMRSSQTAAWYTLGAMEVLGRYGDAHNGLRALVTEMLRAPDAAALHSGIRAACTEFDRAGREGRAYFPAPDPAMAPHWESFVSLAEAGGRDCLRWVHHGDEAALRAGLDRITRATHTRNALIEQLNDVLAESR
ncbi:M48 family metallopeptidase [Saccharopolyspora cebuensis]|uniref:M48 family metallopeptidase n=1 Tax=Saccharopolyspora cebuensis TaxID=418759 RepID=A0ABV4CQN0_9PSEU